MICRDIVTCLCACIWHQKKYYRFLALQISRLDKRVDELEQLQTLEEEIEDLREKFKGNK